VQYPGGIFWGRRWAPRLGWVLLQHNLAQQICRSTNAAGPQACTPGGGVRCGVRARRCRWCGFDCWNRL